MGSPERYTVAGAGGVVVAGLYFPFIIKEDIFHLFLVIEFKLSASNSVYRTEDMIDMLPFWWKHILWLIQIIFQ